MIYCEIKGYGSFFAVYLYIWLQQYQWLVTAALSEEIEATQLFSRVKSRATCKRGEASISLIACIIY